MANEQKMYHRPALHPDDLHRVIVRVGNASNTLAELTPPECRMIAERCIGEKAARALLCDVGPVDEYALWFVFNEIKQKGKLKAVLA